MLNSVDICSHFTLLFKLIKHQLFILSDQMRSYPDYPIINPVESILISKRSPSKSLPSITLLAESKHYHDNDAFIFASPSENCLKKLQNISLTDAYSVGSDPNANLRAFIMVIFSSVFNFQDDLYQNLLIEKITNQVPNLIKKSKINNYKNSESSFQNIIKVISGFVKTLSNKKLNNPQTFDLLKQFQNLSIILDYIIITFRSILDNYGQENASDFCKIVEDSQSYRILSEYFNINFIHKDDFYLFEKNLLFIFKGGSEYLFGHYRSSGSTKVIKQKPGNKIRANYEQNCRIQITECSMESGSMMISSRHSEEANPYFNQSAGDQFALRSIFKKQGSSVYHLKEGKLQHVEQIKISQKCSDLKRSQFQVNVFSQDKNQFFNNKYKSSNQSEKSKHNDSNLGNQSLNTPKEISIPKYDKKQDNKVFMTNNTLSPQRISPIKKVSSDKCLNPSSQSETSTRQKTDSQKISKSNQNTRISANKQTANKDNQTVAERKDDNYNQEKTFLWQNQERQFKKVQTISYKSCSTCHRRFYHNEIQLKVLEITINATPKTNETKEPITKKIQALPSKYAPEFLNKKSNIKLVQIYPKIQSPINIQNSPRHNQKKQAKIPQLSWLSKRSNGQNQNDEEAKNKKATISSQYKKKNSKLNIQLHSKTDQQSPKKILSAKNLFIKPKQLNSPMRPEKNLTKLINTNEHQRQSSEKKLPQQKSKSFFSLKSQNQLQKNRSFDKYDFFKGKILKDGILTNQKNLNTTLQFKNYQLPKENTSLGKYGKNRNQGQNSQRIHMIGPGKEQKWMRTDEKNKIQATRSVQPTKRAERKVPNFVKKNCVNTVLDLVSNN